MGVENSEARTPDFSECEVRLTVAGESRTLTGETLLLSELRV